MKAGWRLRNGEEVGKGEREGNKLVAVWGSGGGQCCPNWPLQVGQSHAPMQNCWGMPSCPLWVSLCFYVRLFSFLFCLFYVNCICILIIIERTWSHELAVFHMELWKQTYHWCHILFFGFQNLSYASEKGEIVSFMFEADDGGWWGMMGDDGGWWGMMGDDGGWWGMMGDDGGWWGMMGDDGGWWGMMLTLNLLSSMGCNVYQNVGSKASLRFRRAYLSNIHVV